MRKMTKIIFGISTSFILIMLIAMVIRLSNGKEAYISLLSIFNFIETFDGYEVLEKSLNAINNVIDTSFDGWKSFSFASSSIEEFFSNIGVFFNNLIDSLTGVFKLIIFGLKGIWDFIWYLINFGFNFLKFVIS